MRCAVLTEGNAALTCSLSRDDDLLIFVVHTPGSFACAIAAGVYCSLKVTEAGPRWDNGTLNNCSLCLKLFMYTESWLISGINACRCSQIEGFFLCKPNSQPTFKVHQCVVLEAYNISHSQPLKHVASLVTRMTDKSFSFSRGTVSLTPFQIHVH